MPYSITKRTTDILFSILLLLLTSPLIIVIILLLFIFNHNDILYLQKRIGQNNKTFNLIKFSTMLKNSEKMSGGTITIRNDPRVTKIGRFLRITKFNELPQLFNVLIGEMSIVGPRPMVNEGFDLYTQDVQSFIYKSKPGITGISSIVFRDEEKLVTESKQPPLEFYKNYIFPYKGQLEKWYFLNKSFKIDFLIIALTGIKLILPKSKFEFKFFHSLPKSDKVYH